jgi:hypothetical protein
MHTHIATGTDCFRVALIASLLLSGAAEICAAGPPRYPDIIEQISHLQIQNEHQREMLRFSTTHINIGNGPLQVRGGRSDRTVRDRRRRSCSMHYLHAGDSGCGWQYRAHAPGRRRVLPSSAQPLASELRCAVRVRIGAVNGPALAAGTKTTFCLVDNDQTLLVKKGSSRGYFDCNAELQGISVGWSDDYHQSTEGQELDITGAPAGIYYLIHYADPDNHWLETDE